MAYLFSMNVSVRFMLPLTMLEKTSDLESKAQIKILDLLGIRFNLASKKKMQTESTTGRRLKHWWALYSTVALATSLFIIFSPQETPGQRFYIK